MLNKTYTVYTPNYKEVVVVVSHTDYDTVLRLGAMVEDFWKDDYIVDMTKQVVDRNEDDTEYCITMHFTLTKRATLEELQKEMDELTVDHARMIAQEYQCYTDGQIDVNRLETRLHRLARRYVKEHDALEKEIEHELHK